MRSDDWEIRHVRLFTSWRFSSPLFVSGNSQGVSGAGAARSNWRACMYRSLAQALQVFFGLSLVPWRGCTRPLKELNQVPAPLSSEHMSCVYTIRISAAGECKACCHLLPSKAECELPPLASPGFSDRCLRSQEASLAVLLVPIQKL